MNYKYSFFWSLLLQLSLVCAATQVAEIRHFLIVVPSYNNAEWYRKNLDSLVGQQTTPEFDFHIVYIDDCSTDGTAELVEEYMAEHHCSDLITLIKNKDRRYALENIYNAIWHEEVQEDWIIVLVDGDDELNGRAVLKYLNSVYKDPQTWLTYGQYKEYPSGKQGICRQVPDWVIKNNKFRSNPWVTSHLRTFYAQLFRRISRRDLMYKNNFAIATWDRLIMLPMLEMAGTHSKFISTPLYVYNTATPLNDYKVRPQLQQDLVKYCNAKEPYRKLSRLFYTRKK
jgi:glycosyltransferase involved in cell wall biosynthesis